MGDLVWGVGPVPAKGMIIGEAPGGEEERQGVPFVGLSGKLLNEAIEAAGASRDDFYITNCYKLRPPNNRTPTNDELSAHESYLEQELDKVRPSFALLLGGTALGWLINMHGVGNARGMWQPYGKVSFMPTWHPSWVFRQGGRDSFAGHEFFGDVRLFVERSLG